MLFSFLHFVCIQNLSFLYRYHVSHFTYMFILFYSLSLSICYKMGETWLIDLDWLDWGLIHSYDRIIFHRLIHILDMCWLARLHIDLDLFLITLFWLIGYILSYTLLYLGYLCVSVCKLQVLGCLTGFGCIIWFSACDWMIWFRRVWLSVM